MTRVRAGRRRIESGAVGLRNVLAVNELHVNVEIAPRVEEAAEPVEQGKLVRLAGLGTHARTVPRPDTISARLWSSMAHRGANALNGRLTRGATLVISPA
jgi:hypothetical protein